MMKVIRVLTVLVLIGMVALALLAPVMGTDTSDGRSEKAHPAQGWYPRV